MNRSTIYAIETFEKNINFVLNMSTDFRSQNANNIPNKIQLNTVWSVVQTLTGMYNPLLKSTNLKSQFEAEIIYTFKDRTSIVGKALSPVGVVYFTMPLPIRRRIQVYHVKNISR